MRSIEILLISSIILGVHSFPVTTIRKNECEIRPTVNDSYHENQNPAAVFYLDYRLPEF